MHFFIPFCIVDSISIECICIFIIIFSIQCELACYWQYKLDLSDTTAANMTTIEQAKLAVANGLEKKKTCFDILRNLKVKSISGVFRGWKYKVKI